MAYIIFNILISYIIKVQHFLHTIHYILLLYKGKEKVCEKQTSIKKIERSKLHKIYGRMHADKQQKKVRMN